MPLRWSSYANLRFAESALHAFARAAELAETDVHEQHGEAWVIDDRHLTFSLETESTRSVIEAMKRFLGLLALQAEAGEVTVVVASSRERWVRHAPSPSSAAQGVTGESESPPSQTIRVSGAATG